MPLKIPTNYYIHITAHCNYSCIYCYNRYNRINQMFLKELTTREYFNFFLDLMPYSPLKITITGGEPMLRKDLKMIVGFLKRISSDSLHISLNTNGSKVDSNNVNWLIDSFNEISISLDGFKSINDKIRGRGSFDRTLKAVALIVGYGGSPSISITRTSLNNTNIEGFIEYMQNEWGIHSFRINDVKIIGKATSLPWLNPDSYSNSPVEERQPFLNPPCFDGAKCLEQTMNILPDGDCYPCHCLQESSFFLGNIKKNPLNDIFKNLDDIKKMYQNYYE